jgi:phosphohistidine phosphatase
LGLELAACYTSPLVRALETARLACEALGGEPTVDAALASGFSADQARELLLAEHDGARVLMVGHEPDFSVIVHELTGGRIDMKKGGVAGLRVDATSAELLVLLRPRELEALAAG